MKKIITLLLVFCMLVPSVSALAAVGSDTSDTDTAIGWTIRSLNSDSWGELDYNTKHKGISSLHVVNKTPAETGRWITVSTSVPLNAGKKYKFGFSAKFTNITKGRIDFADTYKTLTKFGSTAEWTDYEFVYNCTADRPQSTVSFAFDGVCDVWLDEVYVCEVDGDGTNLIKNPGFEGELMEKENTDSEKEDFSASINSSETFSAAEVKKSLATIGYIPVYKVTNHNKDGVFEQWSENSDEIIIPSNDKQKVQYISSGKLDITCNVKLGYDDNNLYIALKVFDKEHYAFNDLNYWTGDSVQIAITGTQDPFGNEMGIVHDEKNQTSGIFTSLPDSVTETIKIKTKHEEEYTYYDIALPWNTVFKEMPKEFKLDVLVNDNDGQGRIGGIDFSGGGIHQSKNNKDFPIMRLIDDGIDYYGWISGADKTDFNSEAEYTLTIVNNGAERLFTLDIPQANVSESFTIPANTVVKRKIILSFPQTGNYDLIAQIKADDKSYTAEKKITVARSQQQLKAYFEEQYPIMENYYKEICELVAECRKQNMPTDYIDVGEGVFFRFLEWMQEDYRDEDFGELEHVVYTLTNIYNETKALAQGYLDGSIEPKYVPRFVSSDLTVEGGQFYADVNNHGKIERSPVNFVGYLTWFYLLEKDFPLMKKLGNTIVHTEVRMHDVIKAPDVNSYWKVYEGLFHPITTSITDEEVQSGRYALKIVDPTEKWVLNSYRYIYQDLKVKPNTTYTFGLSAKGKNVKNAWFTPTNYLTMYKMNGTYDWKSFSGSYTTGEDQTELTFKIYVEDTAEALYLDDVYFCEAGSSENMLKDPGFESGEDFGGVEYKVDYDYIEEVRNNFRKAEENDIRIDLLFAGHNTPKLLAAYPELVYSGGGFFKYNLNADKLKELYEVYVRALIPAVSEFKSFGSVCITNEPAFNAHDASVSDFYKEDWIEFLKKRFNGDIEALNKAFNLDCRDFEEVPMQGGETHSAFEFARKEFADEIFANWHKWLADLVRECAPDALIHSKKVNDMGESDISYARLPAMRGTSTEKWATFSDINGLDAVSSINLSEDGPAKSSFENEFSYYDLSRSVKNMPVDNSEDHAFGGYVDALGEAVVKDGEAGLSIDQTSDSVALNMWSGAMHGRGASTIWIFERNKSEYAKSEAFYGQQVTLYPDILYKTGKASLDLQRLAYEVKALQDQPAEAGIVYAQSGRMMNKSVMNTVHNIYSSLLYNGQRVHFVTESTADTMHNLRLLFVPNLINVKPDVMDELKKFVDNGGKLVIFGKDSLSYDENNVPYPDDVRNYIISRAKVIDITTDGLVVSYPNKNETTKIITEILEYENMNHVQLVDADTGEPIYNTDYFATTFNGKLLVQVSYYAKIAEGTKNIKVLVNGESVAQMKDLISGKNYNDSFTIEPISAVLLEIDTDNQFVDTYGHWAEKDIVDMTEKDIINGVSQTMFAPEKRITRAEFTALLARMLGLKNTEENVFSDIKSSDWFCKEVNAAAKAGITANTSGVFDGNGQMPREEMAYMLKKAYELKFGKTAKTGTSFTDSNLVSAKYKEAVDFVSGSGFISGYEDGSFRPKGMLTRAEAVKVLSKLLGVMI